MAKLREKSSTKAVPTLGKDYKDKPVEGFDGEVDAFQGSGRPAEDGKHFFNFKSPKKGGEVRVIKWTPRDRETGKDLPEEIDFSLRFEAEIVDKDDPDFGKRVFGDFNTFVKEKKGVKTYGAATILNKLGLSPSGRRKQDIDKLASLLAKGFELYSTSRWVAELEYDEKGSAEYKIAQKVPFLRGMNNFPENGDGKFVPLTSVPEDTTVEGVRVKGKERDITYEKGWPLRTYAELVRFESVEEGGA
jgi:hypothetical protein